MEYIEVDMSGKYQHCPATLLPGSGHMCKCGMFIYHANVTLVPDSDVDDVEKMLDTKYETLNKLTVERISEKKYQNHWLNCPNHKDYRKK
jgi:hypothetical protein